MSFSVLISVYAKENPKHLEEALFSIWDQQTLKPGQIVLVKDGMLTEELDTCIRAWKQKINNILTIVELTENVGPAKARNFGLQKCIYELVAIMDSDDVSLPKRFERQIAFMEKNPDIAASSAVLEEWDNTLSKYIDLRILPVEPENIKKFAKYRNPLSNPVAIFRKSIIVSVGGYPPYRRGQDYALWSLLLVKGYRLANLPDILCKQRSGSNYLNRRGLTHFKDEINIYKYQRKIKFLNVYECILNILIRFIIRIVPNFIKIIFYKHRNIRKYQFFIAFVDIILLFASVFISVMIRDSGIPSMNRVLRLYPHFIPIITVWIICLSFSGFYSLEIPRMGYRLLSMLSLIAIACTLFSFGYFYLNIEFQRGPRTILVIYGITVTVLIALWRLFLNKIAKKYLAKINVVFIGINNTIINLLQNMRNSPHIKYNAIFLYNENHLCIDECNDVPVVKDASVLIDEIRKSNVQIIVFAEEMKLSKSIQDVLFKLIANRIVFINVPDFYEIFMRRISLDTINEMKLLSNLNIQSKRVYSLFKRILDVLFAFIFLVLSLPFWPFIILFIKLENSGSVFCKQESSGYLDKPFNIIKFRTMKTADCEGTQVTKIGKFLYKTNMDKIPQFLNVIKSDMSFIGPRPERPELILELGKEVPFYRQRLLVKPGISGWDQVSGEYHSPSKEDTYKKLQYDLYYIKNMSFFLDASIFFKTLVTIVKKIGV